jgi:MFS family permease
LATQSTYGCVYSAFLLLPKFLARELGASAEAIGWVMSLYVAGGLVAVPWVARALDARRRGPLMALGGLLGAATALGFLAVTRVGPLLFALSLLLGVAFVLVFNAGGTLAAELAPPARLGQGLGIWGLATLTTNAVAPVRWSRCGAARVERRLRPSRRSGAAVAGARRRWSARGEPVQPRRRRPTATPTPRLETLAGAVAAASDGLGLGTLSLRRALRPRARSPAP